MNFIYVGRLDELKGIKILFNAWKLMEDKSLELSVCGTGPLEDWCKNFINTNNLSMVTMFGHVPNDEAKQLIANSDALILPTQWYEGFPMSILEAYSVGTPVIASDLGNTGCIVREGITGFKFKSDSCKDLISAIYRLKKCMNIRQSVFEEYKQNYTDISNYEMLCSIYNDIQLRCRNE